MMVKICEGNFLIFIRKQNYCTLHYTGEKRMDCIRLLQIYFFPIFYFFAYNHILKRPFPSPHTLIYSTNNTPLEGLNE